MTPESAPEPHPNHIRSAPPITPPITPQSQGFYDGLSFHSVVKRLANQFGCPFSRDPKDERAGSGTAPAGSHFMNYCTGDDWERVNGNCTRAPPRAPPRAAPRAAPRAPHEPQPDPTRAPPVPHPKHHVGRHPTNCAIERYSNPRPLAFPTGCEPPRHH